MTDSEPEDNAKTPGDDASPADRALIDATDTMTHRHGDTAATIDQALEDGPEVVGELAAEIAVENGLSDDWLAQLGGDSPPPQRGRHAAVRERSVIAVVRVAVRLATRCVTVARQPDGARSRNA